MRRWKTLGKTQWLLIVARESQSIPYGRRETLVAARLFIPQKLVRKKRMPLLVHFHGAEWVAETAAAKDGRWAVISVETGRRCGRSRQFSDHALFAKMRTKPSRRMMQSRHRRASRQFPANRLLYFEPHGLEGRGAAEYRFGVGIQDLHRRNSGRLFARTVQGHAAPNQVNATGTAVLVDVVLSDDN